MRGNRGIVLAVAVALISIVYFYDQWRNPSGRTPENVSNSTFAVSIADIKSITLERAGTNVTFARRADGWYLTQPLAIRGDQPRVRYIATQIAALQTRRTLSVDRGSFSSFGLEHPRITLEFTTNDGKSHALRLGDENTSETSLYALVDNGDDVLLVSDSILTALSWSVEDFRDHTVLDIPIAEATSFDLKNRSGEIEAVKQDSSWKIVIPLSAAGTLWSIPSQLEMVRVARVSRFVSKMVGNDPAELARYGLAKPAIELSIRVDKAPSSPRSVALQIGNRVGKEYFARDTSRPFIFTIDENLYRSLSQTFKDMQQ